jgi:hypothetical protein
MADAFDKVSQRVIPAAGAPRLNPNASVFAAGAAAKPKRVPLDPAKVAVKSGVPVPPLTRFARGSAAKDLLARMKVNDCAELSLTHARSVVSYAKKVGIKVAIRKLGGDLAGVWRLS